ncbi:teichoic acid export ATP-binding protein TagH [Geminocystis sp. NIES-3709]|nr:teichoic acid export ATP-binding protein TagH [Geminocystis sp. NIES-3709]
MNHAIVIENLGKQYLVHHKNKPKTIMESVLSGFKHLKPSETFWALEDVNFTVNFGEMLGIMGKNGSGKSTLLRLIGNIGKPDKGKIQVNGQVRALLDLGAGFHPDLTGRENIFVGGIIAGLTKKEVKQRFDAIVDFAELWEFIDNPLRTYSSGMTMRLAFSVAIHTEPNILLIDEHLSVGDTKFRQKCENKILELKNNDCAIVYVSQSPAQIQQFCDRALWLNQGIVMNYGIAQDVAKQYLASIHNQNKGQNDIFNYENQQKISITNITLIPDSEIETGSYLTVRIRYEVKEIVDNFVIKLNISNDEGQICCAVEKVRSSFSQIIKEGEELITINFARLDLSEGQYFVNVFLVESETQYIYDHHRNINSLTINSTIKTNAIICPPNTWEFMNN